MTQRQVRALSALMLGVKPHHRLPAADEITDGCFAAGLDGRTAQGVAEVMNLWQQLQHANAAGAGRLLNALVRRGFAARVFLPGIQTPRYIATQAGAAEYERRSKETHGQA